MYTSLLRRLILPIPIISPGFVTTFHQVGLQPRRSPAAARRALSTLRPAVGRGDEVRTRDSVGGMI